MTAIECTEADIFERGDLDKHIEENPAGPVLITADDPYGYEPGWYFFGWVDTGKPAPLDKTLDLFGPYDTEALARAVMEGGE